MKSTADTLQAGYVLFGSVLESGAVRGQDGDLPSVGVSIRLVEPATGHVIWAGMRFRSGDDHETLFGWGRERSAERLSSKLARDLVATMRKATRHALRSGANRGGGS
jgi:hypothetical protein